MAEDRSVEQSRIATNSDTTTLSSDGSSPLLSLGTEKTFHTGHGGSLKDYLAAATALDPTPATSTTRTDSQESPDPRRLVFGQDKYRVASFGSSNTWGAGADTRFDAYPYALSPSVQNFAAFSAGPNYYSTCTETVLGDHNTFDIITLEYYLRAPEGVGELALRLRERYPHAVIIFIRLWCPMQFRRRGKDDGEESMSLTAWKEREGLMDASFNELKQALLADNAEWYLLDHLQAEMAINSAMVAVQGTHFEFPCRETGLQTIIDYLGYFDQHHHQHVSSLGHHQIAVSLRDVIQANVPDHDSTAFLNVDNNAHGNWGKGDYCQLWYTSGNIDIDYDREHMTMVEFDGRLGKFALEVDPAGGFLEVINPFEEDRTAYLSFLAAKSHVYPNSTVSYGNNEVVALNTTTDHDKHDIGIIRTVPIGALPPGETKVVVTPQETTDNKLRIVGISFSNERAVPHEYGFGADFA